MGEPQRATPLMQAGSALMNFIAHKLFGDDAWEQSVEFT